MGYNDVQAIPEGGSLDLEIINALAANDAYLKSIIPDVLVNPNISGIVAQSEQGSQMKIQAGAASVPSFTGTTLVTVPFLVAHIGTYNPPVIVSITGQIPMGVTVSAVTSKNFTVKLVSSATGAVRGIYVNWIAITQVAN
jgi:hypothetical protein